MQAMHENSGQDGYRQNVGMVETNQQTSPRAHVSRTARTRPSVPWLSTSRLCPPSTCTKSFSKKQPSCLRLDGGRAQAVYIGRGGLNLAGPEWVPHPAPCTSQAPLSGLPFRLGSAFTRRATFLFIRLLLLLILFLPLATSACIMPHATIATSRVLVRLGGSPCLSPFLDLTPKAVKDTASSGIESTLRALLVCLALGSGSSSLPALARNARGPHRERCQSESPPAEPRFSASSTASRA